MRVDGWFEGPTGQGHGGWAAARMAEAIGESVMVAFRSPIPLDVEMVVEPTATGWQCSHDGRLVLDASPWTPDVPGTEAVAVDTAAGARGQRFPFGPGDHPLPRCFSCGLRSDGMGVHPGPLGGGDRRFATDWTVPGWAVGGDGKVDPGVVWAALDCTAAFYVCCHPVIRPAVTGSYGAELLRPLEPGERLALVGWSGDSVDGWDGRKREAASVAFDPEGRLVARARSVWVALE